MAKRKEISAYCTKSFLYKHELYHYPDKEWFISQENELLGVNLKSIMDESRLKIEAYGYTPIFDIKQASEQIEDIKDARVAGIVKFCEFKQAKSGKYFYWIGIVDDRSFIKAYCSEDNFKKFNMHILKGKCSLFNISVRNGFISFDKCVLMDIVQFKRGYAFQIELPYGLWTTAIKEYIEDELDVTIRRGTVQVFLRTYEYDLFIDPTYNLIEIIKGKFGVKCSLKPIENLFSNTNKLIKEMEENGY